jgi:hypothetical protein
LLKLSLPKAHKKKPHGDDIYSKSGQRKKIPFNLHSCYLSLFRHYLVLILKQFSISWEKEKKLESKQRVAVLLLR